MTAVELTPEDAYAWQKREPIEGVAFFLGDPVVLLAPDAHDLRGRVRELVRVEPEPIYVVIFEHGGDHRTVPQSALRTAHAEQPTSVLAELSQWFASETDGDWEHTHGIEIGTLDDPGWTVSIALTDTRLSGRPFPEVGDLGPLTDWMHCRVDGETWRASCGPFMLERAIRVFLNWAHAASGGDT
jgi:hypothetical protein